MTLPKSISLKSPSLSIQMFNGFMSICANPSVCKRDRALLIAAQKPSREPAVKAMRKRIRERINFRKMEGHAARTLEHTLESTPKTLHRQHASASLSVCM